MDQFMEWLISTPSLLLVVSLVVFVVTLIMILSRLPTVIMTLILAGILYGSGYLLWNHEEVTRSLREYYKEQPAKENGTLSSKGSKTLNLIKQFVQDSIQYVKEKVDGTP